MGAPFEACMAAIALRDWALSGICCPLPAEKVLRILSRILFGLVRGNRAVVVEGVEILLALLGGGVTLLFKILDRGIARFTSTWQKAIS